jgi:hypothetical protein
MTTGFGSFGTTADVAKAFAAFCHERGIREGVLLPYSRSSVFGSLAVRVEGGEADSLVGDPADWFTASRGDRIKVSSAIAKLLTDAEARSEARGEMGAFDRKRLVEHVRVLVSSSPSSSSFDVPSRSILWAWPRPFSGSQDDGESSYQLGIVVLADEIGSTQDRDRGLDDLRSVCESHVAVYLDQHYRILRDADRRFHEARRDGSGGALLDTLARVARIALRADEAAIYVPSIRPEPGDERPQQVLRRFHPSTGRNDHGRTPRFPNELGLVAGRTTIPVAAHQQSRAMVYRRLDEASEGSVAWRPASSPAPTLELALPVPATGEAAGRAHLAVIALRWESASRDLSRRDIVLLTHLCRQVFAVQQHNFLVSMADVFSGLPPSLRAETIPPIEDRIASVTDSDGPLVPTDLAMLRDAMQQVVDRLLEDSTASSVSIRLLSTDRRSAVRFVSAPPLNMGDTYSTIALRPPPCTVIPWVAHHGTRCYLKDIRHVPPAFVGLAKPIVPVSSTGVARPIVSSLCTPLFANGSLIGVLVMHSPFIDAFAGTEELVSSIVSRLQLYIEQNMASLERDTLSLGANLQAAAHDVSEIARTLLGGGLSDQRQIELGNRLTELLLQVDAPAGTAQPAASLTALVHQATEDALARNLTLRVSFLGEADQAFSTRVGRAVRFAVSEVLTNVARHGDPEVTKDGTIRRAEIRLMQETKVQGGIHYAVVDIVARPAELQSVPLADLYRVPVRFSDRASHEGQGADADAIHIGAFLAGVSMRAVGGDLVVAGFERGGLGTRLRSQVLIPLDQSDRS